MMVMYTVDRIEEGYYILLKKGNESQVLHIPIKQVRNRVQEGDVVSIIELDGAAYQYELHVRPAETHRMKQDVSALLKKLQSKK